MRRPALGGGMEGKEEQQVRDPESREMLARMLDFGVIPGSVELSAGTQGERASWALRKRNL